MNEIPVSDEQLSNEPQKAYAFTIKCVGHGTDEYEAWEYALDALRVNDLEVDDLDWECLDDQDIRVPPSPMVVVVRSAYASSIMAIPVVLSEDDGVLLAESMNRHFMKAGESITVTVYPETAWNTFAKQLTSLPKDGS